MRVSNSTKAVTTRRPQAKRLPSISIGATLSRKIDKAIVDPKKHAERKLKFSTTAGFVSPSGNRMQVVYLQAAASKSGLNIAYVDARAKQFWAQAPGVSGLARGPFTLPTGVGGELAKVTARELKPAKKPAHPVTRDDFGGGRRVRGDGSGGVFVRTGGSGGRTVRTDGSGGIFVRTRGDGSGGVFVGGGGGGGGGS